MPGVKVVYTRTTDKALVPIWRRTCRPGPTLRTTPGAISSFDPCQRGAAGNLRQGVETLIMGETPKEQRYNENALYESNREDLIDMSDERTGAIVRAYIQNLQFTYGEYSMAIARCIQTQYLQAGRHSRG